MTLFLVTLLGGILDRLRGFNASDVYKSTNRPVPKLARWGGYLTNHYLMAFFMALLVVGVSALHDTESFKYYLFGLFVACFLGFALGGAKGRSRTYAAYSGKYETDDDYTKIVGQLIPGDSKFVNHVRGMVETSFYGIMLAGPAYAYLFFVGFHADALIYFPAYLVSRGLAKGLVAFVPETIPFPDINWETGKPFTDRAAYMRHAISEFVEGCALLFWLSYTIMY